MSEEERRILQLVIQGGDARCAAMEAIEAAREGKFARAEVLLERSGQTLALARRPTCSRRSWAGSGGALLFSWFTPRTIL